MTSLREGRKIHPFFHSIMGTNFNIKEFPVDLSDISTGRNRLRNAMSSDNLSHRTDRIKKVGEGESERFVNYLGFDESDVGKRKKIITYDTETSGLTPEARIRSFSLVEREVEILSDGTTKVVSAPQIVMTKHFKTDKMDLAHVYENGRPVPLSERNHSCRNGRLKNWLRRIRKSIKRIRRWSEPYL